MVGRDAWNIDPDQHCCLCLSSHGETVCAILGVGRRQGVHAVYGACYASSELCASDYLEKKVIKPIMTSAETAVNLTQRISAIRKACKFSANFRRNRG